MRGEAPATGSSLPGFQASRLPGLERGCRGVPSQVSQWVTGPGSGVLEREALKTRKEAEDGSGGSGGGVSRSQEQMGSVLAATVGPPAREQGPEHTLTVGSYLRTSGSV